MEARRRGVIQAGNERRVGTKRRSESKRKRDRITAALKEDKEQQEREVHAAKDRVHKAKGDR